MQHIKSHLKKKKINFLFKLILLAIVMIFWGTSYWFKATEGKIMNEIMNKVEEGDRTQPIKTNRDRP